MTRVTPPGIAPQARFLLGQESGTNPTGYGAFIRVNLTTNRLIQNDGIVLVEPAGNNYNVLESGSDYKVFNVGHCRMVGNELSAHNTTGTTISNNYGFYSGRGRSTNIIMAFPSDRVWGSRHMMPVSTGMEKFSRFMYSSGGAYIDSDSFYSASIAAGCLALVKSKYPTYSYEDCLTMLYQACKRYQIRTIPLDSGGSKFYGGGLILSGSIGVPDNFLIVPSSIGGTGSTNPWHALPGGNAMDVNGNYYSVIQFGTNPLDSEYELIKYGQLIPDSSVSSKNQTVYPGGIISGLIRGFSGTTAKAHASSNIYTPLITQSGWDEYLGWGIPDMVEALNIKEQNLTIMPPWSFGVISNTGKNIINFEVRPLRSRNYSHFAIIRNTNRYPLTPNDGIPVFASANSGMVVSGSDTFLPSGILYYSVFQYANNLDQYSKPAMYAAGKGVNNVWEINTVVRYQELGMDWAPYDNISGYKLLVATGGVVVETYDNKNVSAFNYPNTSGYTNMTVTLLAISTSGTHTASSDKIVDLSDYILATFNTSVFDTHSIIFATGNGSPRYMTLMASGNGYMPEVFVYSGGPMIYPGSLRDASVWLTDINGRESNVTSLNYIDNRSLDTLEYSVRSDYSNIVSTLYADTGLKAYHFDTTTFDSGVRLVVETGGTYLNNFDTIYIQRQKYFLGKPLFIYADGLYIGTTFGDVMSNMKTITSGINYVAISPKLRR